MTVWLVCMFISLDIILLILVGYPRVYNTTPHNQKEGVSIQDTVVFTLYVIANPKPHTYTWTFQSEDGQQTTLPSNTEQTDGERSSVLTITDVKEGDFGQYSCLVANIIGGSDPIQFILTNESNNNSKELSHDNLVKQTTN